MGTLGQYLRNAREVNGIDIRDAAQQTRININYLIGLEAEDFSKLPGEVFVKGFLKNYARFLKLDEAEALKRYAELKPAPLPAATGAAGQNGAEKKETNPEIHSEKREETPIEPFVWGSIIFVSLLVFLFTSLPGRHSKKNNQPQMPGIFMPSGQPLETAQSPSTRPDKLYLEVVALEDTWLLIRTDTSPQKKAVLKKGESLIWSADERFLLSYGHAGDLKLLLNGEELTVRGTPQTPIRDLAVTRAGVLNQPGPAPKQAQSAVMPKPKQAVHLQSHQASTVKPAVTVPAPASVPDKKSSAKAAVPAQQSKAPASVPLKQEPTPAAMPAQKTSAPEIVQPPAAVPAATTPAPAPPAQPGPPQ